MAGPDSGLPGGTILELIASRLMKSSSIALSKSAIASLRLFRSAPPREMRSALTFNRYGVEEHSRHAVAWLVTELH